MKKGNIQDVYALSPLQQGMLFHTLYEPQTGLYCEQLSLAIHDAVDVAAFRQAWQRVVERHPVLRTFFVWERYDKPVQIVRGRVKLPWQELDWRDTDPAEQQERFDDFVEDDHRQGFDLSKAPLMRLTLVQMADRIYRFVWSYHHLLLDGWSTAAVLKEVLVFYTAFHQGQDLRLERPRPYRDYILWLQQHAQHMEQAEQFWRDLLKDFSTPTPLGMGQTTTLSPAPETIYDERRIQLSESTTNALRSLAREHQLTLNTLLQGAWALLLSRYSGLEDVVFGITSFGRPADLAGSESMVGLFINTLPVRAQMPPQARLLPWLQDLQAQQAEIRQYEYVPLVRVQAWSDVPPEYPLFESLLVFENYPMDEALAKYDELKIRDIQMVERTNYPLTLVAIPGATLEIGVLYDKHRFEAATITRMLGHIQTLLEGFVTNPERQLADLPLLTAGERRRLLVEWNDTSTAYPRDARLTELFVAQVKQSPNATAVMWGDEQLTYYELNRRANQLAHHLRALGVGPESLVGLCVERSPDMLVGLLGILKAGGAYVPLDPSYPRERLAFMLTDIQAPVLLTQQRLRPNLPEHAARVVCLDADWQRIAQESPDEPVGEGEAQQIAYVMYTSGSTGTPKGVCVSHRAISRLVINTNYIELGPLDNVSQAANACFDAATFEIWGALLLGGKLVVISKDVALSPPEFAAQIRAQRISALFLTTALFNQLSREAPSSLRPVKHLMFGGEAADPRWVREMLEKDPPERLLNVYGPTESTTYASWYLVRTVPQEATTVPIGKPIANTQIYVLDHRMRPVPGGVPGELCIGGDGLARGYLRRPDLTAEKFVPHPFSDQAGARLYRTGDLVHYRPDGAIEFLGRTDHQVKIRGFRVELGEIEAVLTQHPAVQEAVLLTPQIEHGQKRLVAYVVTPDPPPSQDQLRRFLLDRLPGYMVPALFVTLQALPLTPSGKVDRQALPAPGTERPTLETGFAAPRTPTEQTLARIWAELLGLEQVGVHDNFFALGGDSIISIQVVARANQAGLQLTPRQLFEQPTISALAQVADATPSLPVEPEAVTGPAPLTPIQRWFFEQRLPQPHHFNQSLLFNLPREVNLALLQQGLAHLLVHHDALRLRFARDDSGWRQWHADHAATVPFTHLDLSALPAARRGAALTAAAAAVQASLNLAAGPLLRGAFFDLGPQAGARLLLAIHHLVVDGVSWRILLEDLQTAYQQLSLGQAVKLPPKTTSFQAWAQRLTAYARDGHLRQEVDYWLAGLPDALLPLPLDYPGAANTVASVRSVSAWLDATETEALLQRVPQAYQTHINDALLTALGQVLTRWTGSPWLLLNLEGHGRQDLFADLNLSRTVGWFTVIYPLLLDLRQADEPGAALKSVKEQLRRVPQGGIGYGLLRHLAQDPALATQLATRPQPEVSFNYLGQFDQVLPASSLFSLAQEASGATQSQRGQRPHLLDVSGYVVNGQLRVDWMYSQNLHRRATIEELATGFVEALRALIAHCQSPQVGGFTPSDVPGAQLSQAELDEFLDEFGQGDD